MATPIARGSLLLAAFAVAFAPSVTAQEPAPVAERLSSRNAGDRLSGLRGLVTLGAPPATVRRLLAPLVRDPSDDVRAELAWTAAELLGEGGMDILNRLIRDPQPRVRENAVRAVCRMWDRSRARLACATAFEDPDSVVRTEVVRTLRENFPRDRAAAALFRRALRDDSPAVQRAAVFGCQAARDTGAVSDLLEVARSASDLAAVPAAEEALASIATPEAIAALASLLSPGSPGNPSAEVRAAAARALARIGAEPAPGMLRRLLTDPEVTVRLAAMEGLLRLGDRESVPGVEANLTHPDVKVRRYALRVLGQLGDARSANAVLRVMRGDRVSVVRASAVLTYAEVLGPGAVTQIGELRRDPDAIVRLEAAGALAGLGPPACAALSLFLEDPSTKVRARAASGLGPIGTPTEIPRLDTASRTADRSVRVAVARALGQIGDEAGVPTLTRLARDRDPVVRGAAAFGLGMIGGAAARSVLRALTGDPVPGVRSAAARALTLSRAR